MPDFPKTPNLSLFLPPAENPLSEGGKWAQTTPDRPPLKKIDVGGGNGAGTDSSHGDPNYSHWAAQIFESGSGADAAVEVWACTSGGQLGAALETWRVALWSTVGLGLSGYLAYYGGGIGKEFVIRKYSGGVGSFVGIGSGAGGYPDKLGLRINGPDVECWAEFGGVWGFQFAVEDEDYRGAFWLGLAIEDPTAGGLGFPCFGGGVPRRTQFFRWTRGFKEQGVA